MADALFAFIWSSRFATGCLAAALVLCAVAVVDHRDKQARINHAQLLEYYCTHGGTHCGGPSWRTIEHHWQIRQYAYEGAVATLVLAGGTVAIVLFATRSRSRPAR